MAPAPTLPLIKADTAEEFRGQLLLYLRLRINALNAVAYSPKSIASRARTQAAVEAYEEIVHVVELARPRESALRKAEQGG